MTDKKYNGWTNYETWAVKLWMDNDHGSYLMWRECTSALIDEYVERLDEGDLERWERCGGWLVSQLADQVKDFHEEANPLEEQASVFTDLLRGALSEVDWREIAEHLVEESDDVERVLDWGEDWTKIAAQGGK